ncbi:PQQ-like beta-propeller repeat protein [Fodinicurvata fenggangensis]|uniref:PQQ-like beta-propeller repeat protein n=1 Tax=Fodinicurvata fenggangensis TaxID=1121830 RepID=UPI00047E33C5|nr:PQQ-like beta-propeller repeat protein [Fodinicurvata fenggangensis]
MSNKLLTTLALSGALLLGGCGTVDGWFGEPEAPPLPGKRISVLDSDRTLEADAEARDSRITIPTAVRNNDWAQSGGNARNDLQNLTLSSSLNRAWSSSIGSGNSEGNRLLAQPIVVGDTIYAMDSRSRVSALSSGNGGQKWRVDLSGDRDSDGRFGGGLAYKDGTLFVTTGFGEVFALDPASGQVKWENTTLLPVRAAPTVANNQVYVISLDNRLYAFDADSGERVWDFPGIEEETAFIGAAAPVANDDSVVAAFSSGEIVSVMSRNGRALWDDSLAGFRRMDRSRGLAHIRGMPVLDRGLLTAISNAGRMVAIDQRRGLRVWEASVGGIEMPWSSGNMVYVLSNNNELVALLREEGTIRWVAQLPRFEDPEDREDPIIWYGPVMGGGNLVIAGSNGDLRLYDARSGELRSQINLPAGAAISPVIARETLYVVTDDGQLLALR